MADYDDWADRGYDQCGDDPACWEKFMFDSMSAAKSPETAARIHDGFMHNTLPLLIDRAKENWYSEYGIDLEAWSNFIQNVPDEFRDTIVREVSRYIQEQLKEQIEKTLENRKARSNFRPYMQELIDDIIAGYLQGKTQREIAEDAGYALHSIWNTTWWMRTYAGIELWP